MMFYKEKIAIIAAGALLSSFLLVGCQASGSSKDQEANEVDEAKEVNEVKNLSESEKVQDDLMDVQNYLLEGKDYTLEIESVWLMTKKYEENELTIFESTIFGYVEQKNFNNGEYEIIIFPDYTTVGVLPQRFVVNKQQYDKIDRGEKVEVTITQFFNDKGKEVGKKKSFVEKNIIEPEVVLLTDGRSNLNVDVSQIATNNKRIDVNENRYKVDYGKLEEQWKDYRDEDQEFVEYKIAEGHIEWVKSVPNPNGIASYEMLISYYNEDQEISEKIFADKEFLENKLNREFMDYTMHTGNAVDLIVQTTFNNYTGRIEDKVYLIN